MDVPRRGGWPSPRSWQVAGVVLTATNDGGAQWGTRYLLIAAPPLLLLAARAATDATGDGRWRVPRLAVLSVILLAGAATSRSAYLELRGAKRNYQSLVAATQSFTRPGDVIVTNLWWLDQVTAALHGTRTFLLRSRQRGRLTRAGHASRRTHRRGRAGMVGGRRGIPLRARRGARWHVLSHGSVHEVALRSVRFAAARCAAE
jgi:hypothetical protein